LSLRVAIGTYNINGGKHFRSVVYKNVSLDDWLLDAHTGKVKDTLVELDTGEQDGQAEKVVDMYAIGFEEMVDLDAKNIVNAGKENAKEWAMELGKTLNRDRAYSLVTFHQLVGVCLYLFVRPELAQHIKDVHVEDVKTGMGGATGNKGSVAISLTYKASTLVFLASHFAAGQKEVQERNNDFAEAVKRVSFPNGRTVLSHDYVFWCGDFNYRIGLPRDEVKHAVEKADYEELRAADQLLVEHGAGNVFQGFTEGELAFPPTYKYDLFSDDFDTSEKARVPAWTDRVLWRRRKPQGRTHPDWGPDSIAFYGRAELKQSDHRPVLAVLDVQARVVDGAKREEVVEGILAKMGPSDGTVVCTPREGPGLVILSEDVVGAITSKMAEHGEVRYSRAVRGTVWTQFRYTAHLWEMI
jgi:phosphatidylinositol-bisphosphatase